MVNTDSVDTFCLKVQNCRPSKRSASLWPWSCTKWTVLGDLWGAKRHLCFTLNTHWMKKKTFIWYLEERRLWQFPQWLSSLASFSGISVGSSEQDLFLAWVKDVFLCWRKQYKLHHRFWWNRWRGAIQNIRLLVVFCIYFRPLIIDTLRDLADLITMYLHFFPARC